MRAVVQRAGPSRVEVKGETVGRIEKGLVVFAGVGQDDDTTDCSYMADKIAGLRIFEDAQGKMNRSLQEVAGEVLCVSQFTLYGDTRKGRRPSFGQAANPDKAEKLYLMLCQLLREKGIRVAAGIFQAEMRVFVENEGPVTILIDSKKQI